MYHRHSHYSAVFARYLTRVAERVLRFREDDRRSASPLTAIPWRRDFIDENFCVVGGRNPRIEYQIRTFKRLRNSQRLVMIVHYYRQPNTSSMIDLPQHDIPYVSRTAIPNVLPINLISQRTHLILHHIPRFPPSHPFERHISSKLYISSPVTSPQPVSLRGGMGGRVGTPAHINGAASTNGIPFGI